MYAFAEMLELTGQTWPSDAHRVVAEKVLIGNAHYHSLDALKDGARIIAGIAPEQIKTITAKQLSELGIWF